MNHGDGNYEASYVVTRAGEYQLVRISPQLHHRLSTLWTVCLLILQPPTYRIQFGFRNNVCLAAFVR